MALFGGGDDTGALSRSAGFIQGLIGGYQGSQDRAAQQEKARQERELHALRMARPASDHGYPGIPGELAAKFVPEWSREVTWPVGFGNPASMQSREKMNAAKLANQWAIAKQRSGGAYDEKEARRTALESIGGQMMGTLLGMDPEKSEGYEAAYNSYRSTFGLAPVSLFQYSEEPGGMFGGTTKKASWIQQGFDPSGAAPAAPRAVQTPTKNPAPAKKPTDLSGY